MENGELQVTIEEQQKQAERNRKYKKFVIVFYFIILTASVVSGIVSILKGNTTISGMLLAGKIMFIVAVPFSIAVFGEKLGIKLDDIKWYIYIPVFGAAIVLSILDDCYNFVENDGFIVYACSYIMLTEIEIIYFSRKNKELPESKQSNNIQTSFYIIVFIASIASLSLLIKTINVYEEANRKIVTLHNIPYNYSLEEVIEQYEEKNDKGETEYQIFEYIEDNSTYREYIRDHYNMRICEDIFGEDEVRSFVNDYIFDHAEDYYR